MKLGEYFVSIKPEINKNTLERGAREIEGRFTRIAKGFGKSLSKFASLGLKGGAVGAALAAVAAVLNTGYNDAAKQVDEFLQSTDLISTLTNQLKDEGVNLSSGEVYRAAQVAKVAGVSEEDFVKFLAIFERRIGNLQGMEKYIGKPLLDSFQNFFTELSSMDAYQRRQALASVFGDAKAVGLQELSQTNLLEATREIDKIFATLGVTTQELSNIIDRGASLETLQARNRVEISTQKLINQSKNITEQTLQSQKNVEKARIDAEKKQLEMFDSIARQEALQISIASSAKDIKASIVSGVVPALEVVKKGIEATTPVVREIGRAVAGTSDAIIGAAPETGGRLLDAAKKSLFEGGLR